MSGPAGPGGHGYGGHRPESFARYYRRAVLSEGCGCAEQGLGTGSRPGEAGPLLGALLLVPAAFARAWRRMTRRRAAPDLRPR